MTQIMVPVRGITITRLQERCTETPSITFSEFVGALLDLAAQPGNAIIGIAPSVWRVYEAAAKERGYSGATELISALLADWPAVLAPVAPKGAVVEAQDFPFGGTF